MKTELLDLLRCPRTGQKLVLADAHGQLDVDAGWLVTEDGNNRYPIRDGIPYFVPESNYADSFGIQWNCFRKTQLDSHTGHPVSAARFWKSTDWAPQDLKGQFVLDVGCGAGRFSEIALNAGAKVVALDYSNAVHACHDNLRHHPDFHVVRGDIYALPFIRGIFPFVYSFGVLQHTPDVAGAFAALPPMLAVEGRLCVDFYEKSWRSLFHVKYWLRPLTRRLPPRILFPLVKEIIVPVFLPVNRLLSRLPYLGRALMRTVPVACYYNVLPLNDIQQKEWSLLDTFDWFSPKHDSPQTPATVKGWMERCGMCEIEVLRAGHLVVRGRRGFHGK